MNPENRSSEPGRAEDELVARLIAQHLRREDIHRALVEGSRDDPKTFLPRLAELLRKTLSLLAVSRRVGDSLSLDVVLPRLVELLCEFLDAERCTIFLHDPESDELFTQVGVGLAGEIRIPARSGIAGASFRAGRPLLIEDPYADPRFNPDVDRRTGFRTRDILVAPIRHHTDGATRIVGVSQVLNKRSGRFDDDDLALLETLTTHAATLLMNARLHSEIARARAEEARLLDVALALSSELQLDPLLRKIMDTVCDLLDAERATLFLHDPVENRLWARLYRDPGAPEIRFPSHVGISGSVFTTGETINIPDAYADPRFNSEVDQSTGFHTRNILCMPVVNRRGECIAVTQVLNKRGGPFGPHDERRLRAFSAQAAVAMENARLFDEVVRVKNYNESILQSMSNGVVTVDASGEIAKVNAAALRVLQAPATDLVGRSLAAVFRGGNAWVAASAADVRDHGTPRVAVDADLGLPLDRDRTTASASVNLTTVPLGDAGCMLMIEDITREKRLKSTMARYMTKELADKLLEEGDAALGGKLGRASVLFTDIREFTSISERIGPQETVRMLNEYFGIMVDVIFDHGGILDKYIGDAMMAVFGAPFRTPDDADHAVQAAIGMLRALDALNDRRRSEAQEPIRMGIGVSTDEVLSGNVGSLKRMDYTVIGDGVNLASRLEGANKQYGTQILIADTTARDLRGTYRTREIDLLRVKGKDRPVAVYEVLDHMSTSREDAVSDLLARFPKALDLYRAREWSRASALFADLAEAHDDAPSRLYVDRCRRLAVLPPPDSWDGVWTMTEK